MNRGHRRNCGCSSSLRLQLFEFEPRSTYMRQAPARIFLQTTAEQQSDLRRCVHRQRAKVGLRAQHRRKCVGHVVARKRAGAREHLEEDAAERPDVRCACPPGLGSPAPGAIYAAMPRIMPTPVVIAGEVIVGEFGRISGALLAARSSAFARPKSRTFTVPSARTLIFAGLRSRWMIPAREPLRGRPRSA